jgi:hypothetical protein
MIHSFCEKDFFLSNADGAQIYGLKFQKPIRARSLQESSQMRESDGEPKNIAGSDKLSHRKHRLAQTLHAPGAFPSLVMLRITPAASIRNSILITS